MTTDLSSPHSVVTNVALIQTRGMSSTGDKPVLESRSDSHGLNYDVVDTRPRPSDRVGAAVYSLAQRLRAIPQVRAVAYATEGNVHLVWTFIPQRSKQVREGIYGQERQLMAAFPELTFDFNVLSVDQMAERPLLPDDIQGQLVYYRGEP
jgi:hypothetical protein